MIEYPTDAGWTLLGNITSEQSEGQVLVEYADPPTGNEASGYCFPSLIDPTNDVGPDGIHVHVIW
jgi:hypothetical protein